MVKTKEVEMQKIKTLVENQKKLERKNNIVIMALENRSKNAKEIEIELFKENVEIQIENKVKWVKEMGFNKKIILVSLKAWERGISRKWWKKEAVEGWQNLYKSWFI